MLLKTCCHSMCWLIDGLQFGRKCGNSHSLFQTTMAFVVMSSGAMTERGRPPPSHNA